MAWLRAVAWLLLPVAALHVAPEHAEERIGCTAVAIDGAASTDGSAFAGMNADSSDADFRLTFVPAKEHMEGVTRPVFTFNLTYPRWVGFGRGEFFHPEKGQGLSIPVGHIPEARRTHGYYEATEPLMNDQGLGLGESSCAAMLVNRFPSDDTDARDVPVGLLDTVTLMQLALERCASARCAVALMGQVSEEFGFVPTPGEPSVGRVHGRTAWDDAGEAYTAADKNGEAWVFHVLGGVNDITKSIWAAQRVPKGHLALVANDFVIGELPSEPNDDYLFSPDIFRAAKAAGLWGGEGALHFSKAFAPDPMTFESPVGATPIPLYASIRRWNMMRLVAPSLDMPFKVNNQDYPFSVKVERPISHRDVMGLFRTQYEGTEFDLTQGILAGPFGNPFRVEGGPHSGQIPRGISIQRTLYSIIAHSGPQRSLAWFAMDTPVTSVYVPLYPSVSAVSKAYSTGYNALLSRDCSWWAFNFVSGYMQLNYAAMSKDDVNPAIERWQDTIDLQRKEMESADALTLGKWQASLQEKIVADWWRFADFLAMKYNDNFLNVPKAGTSIGYPQWYADMVGFGNDVRPLWVQAAQEPQHYIPGFVTPTSVLPVSWDNKTDSWSYTAAIQTSEVASPSAYARQATATLFTLVFGALVGAFFERRRAQSSARYLCKPLLA